MIIYQSLKFTFICILHISVQAANNKMFQTNLFQSCMKELLSSSLSTKSSNPSQKLWKFYLNLAGTVMPQMSVQDMARYSSNREIRHTESNRTAPFKIWCEHQMLINQQSWIPMTKSDSD